MPASSTPPPAHSAAHAASCAARSAAGSSAAYTSHVLCAAAATALGVAPGATSKSLRSTARSITADWLGRELRRRAGGAAAAQVSNTTASERSGPPGSSGSAVAPDHTTARAAGACAAVRATSAPHGAVDGEMAHARGTLHSHPPPPPLSGKARTSITNSSRSARCAYSANSTMVPFAQKASPAPPAVRMRVRLKKMPRSKSMAAPTGCIVAQGAGAMSTPDTRGICARWEGVV